MIELLEQSYDNHLAFRVSGKVSKEEEKEWIERFEISSSNTENSA
tara:strand:+ start:556 stop:690 length:135 start_codon:yes stop_codon:yes gene_type:complete